MSVSSNRTVWNWNRLRNAAMSAPSDRLACRYVGHHRSGSHQARSAARALKRSTKEPSVRSIQRAKKARAEEVASHSPHVAPPGHVFDDDLDDSHDVDDHVLDEEQMMLFEELNQEAEDSEIEKDALFQGVHPVTLLAVGNRLLNQSNRLLLHVTMFLLAVGNRLFKKSNRLLLTVRHPRVTGYFTITTGY
jgi:hypothetical protein